MYASQTKRLCVREASSDETRVQHQRSAQETNNSGSINLQQQPNSMNSISQVSSQLTSSSTNLPGNMTASATESNSSGKSPSIYHNHHHDHQKQRQQQQQQQHKLRQMSEKYQYISSEHELIERLAQETMEETILELLLSLRNLITACNKKRDSVVTNPYFSKLIDLIEHRSSTVKAQIALLLCSIAKSNKNNIKILNDFSVDEKILQVILGSQDETLTEACFRCLRSIMSWPDASRTAIFYDSQKLNRIIQHAQNSDSLVVQECIADIFSATCNRSKDQFTLYRSQAVPCIAKLLESSSDRVIVATLNWMIQLVLKNHLIGSEFVLLKCPSGRLVLDRLVEMMSKDKHDDLQFMSARAYAYIYKPLWATAFKTKCEVEVEDEDFRLKNAQIKMVNDPRVKLFVLSTLVRMVHRSKPSHIRIKSAECLAYLVEGDPGLQFIASVCDHLISSLAGMLDQVYDALMTDIELYQDMKHRDSELTHFKLISRERFAFQAQIDLYGEYETGTNPEDTLNLRRAAFMALATLGSDLETIRKKILDTCSVMQHLVKSLSTSDIETLKAALTCLLSLSRSVQQLRTSFGESRVYSALKGLLSATSNDVLILVLAILCNVSLEFSAGKQHFLDDSTIEALCNFTKRSDPAFRLHGMWTLMNMVYQMKDLTLKLQILRSLGINHVVSLLQDEKTDQPNRDEIIHKTLGFLRNSLSQEEHVDAIMSQYGEQIMKSLVYFLEKPCKPHIKEQTLCVLTNIADGHGSKALIMNDKYILSYLAKVITECDEASSGLRLASICCITNLAYKDSTYKESAYKDFDKSRDQTYLTRRHELNKFGIEDRLKSILGSADPLLSDRARTAYNQFLD